VKLNVWLKAAIVTLAIISIASRIPQVRKFVFNEGAGV
jgi:hypothetical protein